LATAAARCRRGSWPIDNRPQVANLPHNTGWWLTVFRLPADSRRLTATIVLMRRRFLYGLGVVLLVISATLVLWQASFNFGEYAPSSPEQTLLYWAVSTLVFLLMVTLGFILFRTGVKLYIERRSKREGSRIKTKMVVGALALSFVPVFFLVLWSYAVLNYNLAKWFSRPAEGVRQSFYDVLKTAERGSRDKAEAQAMWLADRPETRAILRSGAGSLAALCKEHGIAAAALASNEDVIAMLCGSRGDLHPSAGAPVVENGLTIGRVLVAARPAAAEAARRQLQTYIGQYDRLAVDRRSIRNFYLMLLVLISAFVLFFATWLALFLAKQISNPISALLKAAGQVRQGNLGYRIETHAVDELGTLVRAFNEMTYELEANSRELDLRRRFTEAILESIPTGVISVAADGRILRVNRAFRQMFSEERVAAASRLEDLFTRDDTAEFKYMMKRARRTGATQGQLELKTAHRTRQLSVTVAALEEKLTSGFVIVLEDTSDLLRMQKLAAWHEVARRIAHEIKNPLTPIALCSDRIARQVERLKLPPDAERILRECTATIGDEVESVKTLVNEFSQFARFPAANPVPCDLNEIVESALAVFAGRLDGIEIRKDLAPDLPPVSVDRELFKRVVVNLVDNAAESMQDSPLRRLYVATQATTAETIELTVADTGHGVSPEDRDRLFLPYFSTKGRGTGLGLAIVSHILSEHNATIRVEDNMPQGARFLIEIPVIIAGETAKPGTVRSVRAGVSGFEPGGLD
jgi:two-component system nitrogen regulation sensor histidine kinase NtrY